MIIETLFQYLGKYLNYIFSMNFNQFLLLIEITGIFLLMSIGFRYLARRFNVPNGVIKSVIWLFVLILIYSTEKLVIKPVDDGLLYAPLTIVKTIIWWFFILNILKGFYADLYITRIKKEKINNYFIDVFKFLILIILAVGGLKSILKIELSSLITSSAILTAVIGFSMQDTIGSLISGLLIQIEKPFAFGDWIEVGTFRGKVVQIGWRYTRIQTIERNYVLIPNNSISRDSLINYNRPISKVRWEVEIPVPLEVPPVKAKSALKEAVKNTTLIEKRPLTRIRVDGINEDRMTYVVIFFVKRFNDVRPARDELFSAVWYQFKKNGIEFPYPGREIRHTRKKPPETNTEIIKTLKSIPLFEGLPENGLELLVQSSAIVSFDVGSRIVTQGGAGMTFYIILDGKVAVKRDGENIDELSKDSFFGEMALLTGEERQADVEAIEPTKCIEVDREGFKMLLEKNKSIVANINDMFKERSGNDTGVETGLSETQAGLIARFKSIFL
ncbi:MAG: mechanosensitive ion channel [Desulfobacterales bacterium]|jgi:small-conductance mechanosensitive channel|nr:mechanosensitive ion channel [Desulfobacterales bacterium]